jgi:epoxide hydrolase-like predicted phosphatase
MPIRAIVFDIGGVLEYTPDTGWVDYWEERLHLPAGEINKRLMGVWQAGSVGTISEAEMQRSVAERLGLNDAQLQAFLGDLWREYLGELNTELANYFASLRPRYQTAILSNSFVGAREQEEARYHFSEMCDLLIYSHEEGTGKPARRFFELAWERLGVEPEEMIFLDDVEGHVEAARELGIHAILFTNNAQAIAEIKRALQEDA